MSAHPITISWKSAKAFFWDLYILKFISLILHCQFKQVFEILLNSRTILLYISLKKLRIKLNIFHWINIFVRKRNKHPTFIYSFSSYLPSHRNLIISVIVKLFLICHSTKEVNRSPIIINLPLVLICHIIFVVVKEIYFICDGYLLRWWNNYNFQVQSVWMFRQVTKKITDRRPPVEFPNWPLLPAADPPPYKIPSQYQQLKV